MFIKSNSFRIFVFFVVSGEISTAAFRLNGEADSHPLQKENGSVDRCSLRSTESSFVLKRKGFRFSLESGRVEFCSEAERIPLLRWVGRPSRVCGGRCSSPPYSSRKNKLKSPPVSCLHPSWMPPADVPHYVRGV